MIISINTNKIYSTARFQNEKELQDCIERFPHLLNVITALNGQDSPLFILKREFGVSSGAVDFLAVDKEGSLYIIETKLAENPEIRRTVIGQALEYASNLTDMSYKMIASECLKYLKKNSPLEKIIYDFYADQPSGEPILAEEEYKKVITDNISSGRFNIVIIANKVGFEIQKLFHFIDQVTLDKLNFIVIEINKYPLEIGELLHSGIVWAAKYIKSLYSRNLIDEGAYINSQSSHVQILIKHIDSQCQERGLRKTANSKGLSWKHADGGSIFITNDILSTNWSTLPAKSEKMDEFKEHVMETAKKAGFATSKTKHGIIRLKLTDQVQIENVEAFVDLAFSVLKKAAALAGDRN